MLPSKLYHFLASFPLLVTIKKHLDRFFHGVFELKAVFVKQWRQIFPKYASQSHHFAVMCVKRPAYAELVIKNINSLHYHNPAHQVTVFADRVCAKMLQQSVKRLHYPEQVHVVNYFKTLKYPWQYAKVETLIEAALRQMILMDADSIWHADPHIDPQKVMFLVKAYAVKDHPSEKQVVTVLFRKPAWKRYVHYVTGFVSIPSPYMTPQLVKKMRAYVRKMYMSKFTFLKDPAERASFQRLAEEIAVSFAVQECIPKKMITTLKEVDGPGNTAVLQSLYYGCANQIKE